MSQLIEKLNRAARAAPSPMGFRTTRAAMAKPQMQLIASVAQPESLASLSDHIKGADAVLLYLTKDNIDGKAIQKITRSLDIPWGARLKDPDDEAVDTIIEAGADFVVFSAGSPVSAIPRNGKTGKVLQVETSLNEGLLRTTGDLAVDAMFLADEAGGIGPRLTWHDLMLFQRAANLLTKPLLVPVPATVSDDELKTLWDMGVDGVVIGLNKEVAAGRLEELRKVASSLTGSSRRKRGKTEARLPSLRMETTTEHEEEEEEE